MSNMNTETIRIAYAVSTRELEDEPLSATDNALNASHRGNLPHVYNLMLKHNRQVEAGELDLPRVELAVIIYDDREPPLRDFTDIPVEFVGVCSERLRELRDSRNAAQTAGNETEFARLRAEYGAERARYEQEFLDVLGDAGVDLVMLDRLMVIMGKIYLNEYLGATLNSHPAILPDLPGDTPTADAHARANRGENSWTGVTAHFIDKGIDTGPIIGQRECTEITPGMSVEDVRRTNYQGEGRNFWEAVQNYLSDPDAIDLLKLRRESRELNGSGDEVRRLARRKAKNLIAKYRESFDARWARRKENGLGTGRYQYRAPFGKVQRPQQVAQRVQPQRVRRAFAR
jgi:folate-dependent phosphoribosylglycinamide formyltransferase PurN